MHISFLQFKLKSSYVVLEWICAGIGLVAMAAVALDWNQIIMGLIGLISTYIAFRSHAIAKKVEVVTTEVVAVNKNLEATKHEMNNQMTEALKTAVAKGVLEGIDQERKRRDIQDADRAKGGAAERDKKLERI